VYRLSQPSAWACDVSKTNDSWSEAGGSYEKETKKERRKEGKKESYIVGVGLLELFMKVDS